MHEYGDDFYAFLNSFAERSARVVAPVVAAAVDVRSVVDFGCGEGAWLSVWRGFGADVLGLDGPYVRAARLRIPEASFQPADLCEPINLSRRFDLVQSLEVAEHLPRTCAENFVDTLVRHGDHVLFSAAVPGQGGEHHIHEKPLNYWRSLFAAHDYHAVDLVRPAVRGRQDVQKWYRYNTILYVKAVKLAELPASAREWVVPPDRELPTCWPIADRCRQVLVSVLPVSAVTALSRANLARAARRATQPHY